MLKFDKSEADSTKAQESKDSVLSEGEKSNGDILPKAQYNKREAQNDKGEAQNEVSLENAQESENTEIQEGKVFASDFESFQGGGEGSLLNINDHTATAEPFKSTAKTSPTKCQTCGQSI
ncbi:hypothetical protein T36_0444 [Helicobacter cinaedi]|uniref:hypothetical protein n=1 Tax=Helicobacter cinaedi TaxID=213 RepID=UPI001F37BE05|nr:hypothetical protein [Helicobacter cinaedi]BDB63997.1 hypothetical protein T36_0444 [Helicobacter cinaedi]